MKAESKGYIKSGEKQKRTFMEETNDGRIRKRETLPHKDKLSKEEIPKRKER